MRLLIIALLFAAALPAQTITRNLTLTLDSNKIGAIKLWIANVDQNDTTIDETDITNAVGLNYIQGEIDLLVKRMQRVALRQAADAGRADLLPSDLATVVVNEDTAVAARIPLEEAGASVN